MMEVVVEVGTEKERENGKERVMRVGCERKRQRW
jgi:hypothetical protein